MIATDQPLISVILPTFNRAQYIEESVNSVLSQIYRQFELIVIDDGSTDDTQERIANLPLHYAYQQNKGFAAARNHGVTLARGDFLAFIDSDDIWMSRKLELQLATLQAEPTLMAVHTHAEQFISPELSPEFRARLTHMADTVRPSPVAATLLIHKEAYYQVGDFDETLSIGVDMDWFARLCECGLKFKMLDDILYRRRLHRTNLNLTKADEQRERLLVIKQVLDRRRSKQTDSDKN